MLNRLLPHPTAPVEKATSVRGRQVTSNLPFRVRWRRDWQMVVLMVPGVVFLLVFFYLPILGNLVAFQDFQPFLGIMHSEWNGVQNFVNLYDNPDFWDALRNTLILALAQLVLFFPVPLGLALIVDSLVSNRLRRAFQTIAYLPHFLSWVLVIALFQQSLGGAGFVNNLLRQAGFDPIPFMTNPDMFPLLVVGQLIWKGAPLMRRSHPAIAAAPAR